MKIVAIIPARYSSSRFPGKPLVDICGYPMIWWVYHNMSSNKHFDELLVSTDDVRIVDVCKKYDMKCILTSTDHETGTDRIVEVSEHIDADLYVVVMGDEPLVKSKVVDKIIHEACNSKGIAFMLVTKFKSAVDVVNTTTIKIALNDENEVIFMSRQAIPYPKAAIGFDYYKNIGVYAFRKEALEIYHTTPKGRIERAEDLEMLRLIEKHCIVKAVEVESDAMSVDTPKDLERVRVSIVSQILSGGGDNQIYAVICDSLSNLGQDIFKCPSQTLFGAVA